MKTHKKFKPCRKSKPKSSKPNKPSTPSSDKTKIKPIPLSIIHPPASLNWRKNPSASSSSSEPNRSPPIGMGSNSAKQCHGSSPKPLPKSLFENKADFVEKTANSLSDNVNEAIMDFTTPPSPFQAPGNQYPIPPSSITDWKFSAVPDALKFSSESAKHNYLTSFSSRKLNRGRGVLFSSIPESIVVDWIRGLEWDRITSVEVCYLHLVKLFYANLEIVIDDSENVFGEWNTPEYTLADLCNIFWEGKTYPFSGAKALNNMSMDHFFLHKLIFCTLLPGATTSRGHSTDINTMSMYLTFMAVHGRPVNLGFVLLKYIAYSAMEPPRERRIIDLNSLRKMRIQHSETDGWYRGVKKKDPVEVSSSADSPLRKRTRSSHSTVPPTNPAIALLQDSLASLHAKIDSQSTTILELSNQVEKLRKKLAKRSR
ncbi:hypothetical protein CDL12_26016 [Handroanthus impetiginosus]|uniref:Uncharacterized protein n=1 Tax=Handroanthus impetiginosus TaxID=429701 RepID=A0A2G9G861_9LAMI|nr:hypothetical protein CDL12_26016 [Handroanthus impetiginosus]